MRVRIPPGASLTENLLSGVFGVWLAASGRMPAVGSNRPAREQRGALASAGERVRSRGVGVLAAEHDGFISIVLDGDDLRPRFSGWSGADQEGAFVELVDAKSRPLSGVERQV